MDLRARDHHGPSSRIPRSPMLRVPLGLQRADYGNGYMFSCRVPNFSDPNWAISKISKRCLVRRVEIIECTNELSGMEDNKLATVLLFQIGSSLVVCANIFLCGHA